MSPPVTGTTRVYGIIGWPVAHSLSPVIQNAAFAALGLDAVYVPFAVPPVGLEEAVRGLRRLGVAGFNVTIPHKTAVIPFLDDLSPEAGQIGAVNTVVRRDDRLIGFNTDAAGFLISLQRDLGFSPAGRRVLLLGAGGAARAALAALGGAGVEQVVVANRTVFRAEEMCQQYKVLAPQVDMFGVPLDRLGDSAFLRAFDLLVNTTSLGMEGTSIASLDLTRARPDLRVYDMVYRPAETPLLLMARHLGLPAVNGLGMLAAQGEAAFTLWTGRTPPAGLMGARLTDLVAALDS